MNDAWHQCPVLIRHWPMVAWTFFQPLEQYMNKDQLDGKAKQVKGAAKDAMGSVTGNRTEQAKGKLEKAAGTVQKAFGDAKEKVKQATR